jgi:hypothetical protein
MIAGTLADCSAVAGLAGDRETSLRVAANLSGTTVARVVVEVTAPDIATPLVFNMLVSNGLASGTVTLPAGTARTITLRAYDPGGTLTHSGSWTGTIVDGTNPSISLTILADVGDLPILVTLGTVSVTVAPASTAVPVSGVVQLTAAVQDGEGHPIPAAAPQWATAHPGVATVSATGLVTGERAGTTTIYATYQGAVGTSLITVSIP